MERGARNRGNSEPQRQNWEYKLVSMGNPLEPDVEMRANVLGKQGWELAAIDAGVWVFKRPSVADESPGALEAVFEETVPLAEPAPAEAVPGTSALSVNPPTS